MARPMRRWDQPPAAMSDIHVMPENDLHDHVESRACPCGPSEDPQEPRVVIHHSWDGRERVENLPMQ